MSALDLHRTEYTELKDEQRTRMAIRDQLGYATWAGIGLVLAAGRITGPAASPILWLALPVVVVVLGWTRIQNDLKITRIGQYIREDLAPRVSVLVGEPVFGWETAHNGPGTRRQLRMWCQLIADLTLYTFVPIAALIAYWSSAPLMKPWTGVAGLEALAVIGLATVIILHSGVRLGSNIVKQVKAIESTTTAHLIRPTTTQTVTPSMPSQNEGA